MKNVFSLSLLLALFATHMAYAQQTNQSKGKDKLMEGIRKEKLREPIPLKSSPEEKKSQNTKNTRASDTKVSTVTSNNEEGESQICINPNNPNQLVLSYMDNNSAGEIQYPVYYSSNGGSSWTKSTFNAFNLLSTEFPGYFFVGGGDPVFAWDKNNNLYFSWIYLLMNSSFDTAVAAMHWAKSTDGGSTFNLQSGNNRYIGKSFLDPASPNLDAYPGSEGFYDRQWFAVDNSGGANNGQLYCSFIYFNAPSESPNLTGSTIKKLNAAGTAFGNKIQAMTGSIQFNNVRVDNAGVLHLTGADVDNNSILYCKSSDGGSTFSSPITVYNGTNLFGSQGNGYIHDRENSAVNMEVDGAKHVHVVWSDFTMSSDSNFNSYYSRLNDGTSAFTSPLDLKTLFPAGLRVLMPVVSTYGNRVTIGAYGVNATSKTGDYYIINSDNNGQNWSAPIKLSSASTNYASAQNNGAWFGDYSNAVRTDTKVYNLWSDGRGTGKTKMYVSAYTLWPSAVQDLTPVNSSLQLDDVYPNPAHQLLQLNLRCEKPTSYTLQLVTMDGKMLIKEDRQANTGKSNVTIPVEQLANGMYILRLESKDGFQITRHIAIDHSK